jgi:hypothetical protein
MCVTSLFSTHMPVGGGGGVVVDGIVFDYRD